MWKVIKRGGERKGSYKKYRRKCNSYFVNQKYLQNIKDINY